jgi:spermidine/putrescine ABC transporter ATP-binding subunit
MRQPGDGLPTTPVRGAAVSVRNLVKHYKSVRAVDDVTIDVEPGEFLALLGPSGSGKTTILMTIAGFEQPTGGEVYIGGRAVTYVPPNRREIGMVFQKYALFPHMTVAENVAFPLEMRGVPATERAARVEAALKLVRLAGYGSRRPSQLSGGQQQRVALARAVVYDPPVLLMDEPLGALDKKLREQMQLEIKHIQQQLGTTVVYVTHDQSEALTMADRIAVLHEGRLQQIGVPEELYDRPANSFVADFIGETNFVDGRLVARNGEVVRVVTEEGPIVAGGVPIGAAPAIAEGAAVRVGVRPEHVALSAAGTLDDGCPGVVEESIYGGASVAYIVRVAPTLAIVARVPRGSDAPRWRPGDAVRVTWRPEDARVYERER